MGIQVHSPSARISASDREALLKQVDRLLEGVYLGWSIELCGEVFEISFSHHKGQFRWSMNDYDGKADDFATAIDEAVESVNEWIAVDTDNIYNDLEYRFAEGDTASLSDEEYVVGTILADCADDMVNAYNALVGAGTPNLPLFAKFITLWDFIP